MGAAEHLIDNLTYVKLTMTLRERFEIWAAATFGPLERDGSSYRDLRVHGAWIAWQYLATAPDGE